MATPEDPTPATVTDFQVSRWLGELRSGDEARRRERQRWIEHQAAESATLVGVLRDLAESGAETVVDVAREIVDWAKKIKKIELKGAVLDGELYAGKDGVEALSKFPTRAEAQAQVVQLVLSPAGNLVSAITSPGAEIVSILKTIEEKLEKGEAIAKVN